MKDFKILIALPDSIYFIWQMLVQINNFEKFNYLKNTVYIIGVKNINKIHPALLELQKISKVQILFYVDDRKNKKWMYSSTLRPNILKKYFKEYPDVSKTYFYIDPDLIFTKKMSFDDLIDDDIWYLSDTKSYLDSRYIKSKSNQLFEEMCTIVDINQQLVIDNDENAGGAQYLLKNINSKYWQEVEFVSGQLFEWMKRSEKHYHPEHSIQSWTADMWAVLWLGWKNKHKTKIIKQFDFAWATDTIEKWNERNLYHNAGVFDQDYLFNKGKFGTKHPFNEDLSFVDKKYASINYVKEIKETSKNYKDIIKKL